MGQGPPEIVVEDPATGVAPARLPGGPAASTPRRAPRARRSRARWARWLRHGRAAAARFLGLAALLRDRAEELAQLESRDTGKPLSQARTDVATAARYLEYYGGAADKLLGETIPSEDGAFVYTLREPYGVVARITPWNSPLQPALPAALAPALAAGNTVVVKPSEVAPLSTRLVAGIETRARRGASSPSSTGPGRRPAPRSSTTRSSRTCVHRLGGHRAPRSAWRRRAPDLPVTLELGGKSPTIVFADADLDAAVDAAAAAVIRNAGQSCFATTRILVHDDIHEAFAERLVARFGDLTVGPGREDPDLGPLASRAQLERVLDLLESAVAEGATVACGGGRLEDPALAAGHFVAPTVLTGVANTMRVAREEVFGPVLCVLRFATEDEAVALANASEYGLAAGVLTRDLSAAPPPRAPARGGPGPDQPLPGRRGRAPRSALQAQRHRPREGPRGAAALHADEDGHHLHVDGAPRAAASSPTATPTARPCAPSTSTTPRRRTRTTRRWRWTTTVWAITGDDAPPVVVDAGFRPETARRRGREIVADPIETLARIGVDAAAVRNVVLTHLHYDHSGHLARVPERALLGPGRRARLLDRPLRRPRRHRPHGRAARHRRARAAELRAPGALRRRRRGARAGDHAAPRRWHAPGRRSCASRPPAGRCVLASDATHFDANLQEDRPFAIVHRCPGCTPRSTACGRSRAATTTGSCPVTTRSCSSATPRRARGSRASRSRSRRDTLRD